MLKGRTALVTASMGGIGLAIARALAARGANVVLNGPGAKRGLEHLRLRLARRHRVSVRYDGGHLDAALHASRVALAAMKSRRWGRIVNVAAQGITANAICPGTQSATLPLDRGWTLQ